MRRLSVKRFLSFTLVLVLVTTSYPQTGIAAQIDTQTMLDLQDRGARVAHIQAQLDRGELRRAMISLGVDPA